MYICLEDDDEVCGNKSDEKATAAEARKRKRKKTEIMQNLNKKTEQTEKKRLGKTERKKGVSERVYKIYSTFYIFHLFAMYTLDTGCLFC